MFPCTAIQIFVAAIILSNCGRGAAGRNAGEVQGVRPICWTPIRTYCQTLLNISQDLPSSFIGSSNLDSGLNQSSQLRPPCGSEDVPHSKGKWVRFPGLVVDSVDEFHDQAQYRCGSTVLSFEHNTGHFLCGHLSSEDLQRAAKLFSWHWEPEECYLPRRNNSGASGPDALIQDFLEKAKDSNIALVGDSFSHEQFISLRCLLGKYVVSGEVLISFKTTTDIKITKYDSPFLINRKTLHLIGEPDQTVLYDSYNHTHHQSSRYTERNKVLERDIALSRLEDSFDWESYSNAVTDGEPFGHLLKDKQLYLVLNTGAHWHGNMKGYSIMVINVLAHLQKNFTGKRIFYRASSHGHAGCKDVVSPQPPPEDPSKQKFDYNWRLLKHYNAIWKYEILRLRDPRFVFLDVFPMSEERSDSHSLSRSGSDCFHYCLPGVVDYWNLLLLSFIVYGD